MTSVQVDKCQGQLQMNLVFSDQKGVRWQYEKMKAQLSSRTRSRDKWERMRSGKTSWTENDGRTAKIIQRRKECRRVIKSSTHQEKRWRCTFPRIDTCICETEDVRNNVRHQTKKMNHTFDIDVIARSAESLTLMWWWNGVFYDLSPPPPLFFYQCV